MAVTFISDVSTVYICGRAASARPIFITGDAGPASSFTNATGSGPTSSATASSHYPTSGCSTSASGWQFPSSCTSSWTALCLCVNGTAASCTSSLYANCTNSYQGGKSSDPLMATTPQMTPKTPKMPKSEKTNSDCEKDDEHVSLKSQSSKKCHDSDKEKNMM